MSACSLCERYPAKPAAEQGKATLIKYSDRHYAHADCALKRWGAAFFDRLTPWQADNQFPIMVAADFGLEQALRARAKS